MCFLFAHSAAMSQSACSKQMMLRVKRLMQASLQYMYSKYIKMALHACYIVLLFVIGPHSILFEDIRSTLILYGELYSLMFCISTLCELSVTMKALINTCRIPRLNII